MFILKWIFNFIKFIIREIFSLIIKLGFIVLIIFLAFYYFDKKEKTVVHTKSFLKLDLSKEFNENLVLTPFNLKNDGINFYQLLKKIKLSESDNDIEGIIIFTDNNTLNKPQIAELGKVLDNFKLSNKPIYSYGTIMDNNTLLISSYSTESIMPPSASTMVNVTGYNKELPYYKGLADKLGIDVNVIHVGDFKTYGENYTRENISEENKADLTRILDKIYLSSVKNISNNLKINETNLNELILSGEFMGESSLALKNENLISTLNYWENFKNEKNIKSFTDIEAYSPIDKLPISNNKIAIIYADGDISYSPSKGLSSSGITPKKIIDALDKAEKNDNVKGIVIRINSPGGSALASDIIYNSVKNITKPVYISIGSIAASGGYYIASAGNKIFADNNSITGSIGVVSLIPTFNELTNKLGVNFDEITLGKYANLYSLTESMTPERKEKIYSTSLRVYNEFKQKVATGRHLSLEEVEKLAQGKVWLGEEAIHNGLIDSIGGINDTIESLSKDLNISEDYSVIEISYEESLRSMFESSILPFQTLFNFNLFKSSENLKNMIKNEELLFKPILYTNF